MKKIADNIYKHSGDGNVYFLDFEKKVLIDTGRNDDRKELIKSLKEVVNPEDIEIVIFTHLHLDHTGNFDLFKAKFYASKEAIEDLRRDSYGTVLNEEIANNLSKINIEPLPDEILGLKVIKTPGHTRGSVCLYYEDILFSGDTKFSEDVFGRTDLPTSVPEEMENSLKKIKKLNIKILCPGHDY